MTEYEVLDVARRAMLVTLEISMPGLLASLAVGFIIGLLQALTSVQETTLTFVPKIAVMIAVLWVATDAMGRALGGFFKNVILTSMLQI